MSEMKQALDAQFAAQSSLLSQISTSISNVAADVQALLAQLSAGGMAPEEESAVLADLQAKTAALEEIAANAAAAAGLSTAGDAPTP
jgi:hypothetical protein